VVKAVDVPVTVKTRIGWTDKEINIWTLPSAWRCGAQMITRYGRTRAQGYNGSAKWVDWCWEVLTIPVIANGDIFPCSGGEVSGANWC